MKESLSDAVEELKRVDHLIYVSLKYTRTTDVIRSIIERMTNCGDFLIRALLLKAKKKPDDLPTSPGAKAAMVKEIYTDATVQEFLEFYNLLRRILRAHGTKSEEYRRHVTLHVALDEGILNLDIDKIMEFNEKIKGFLSYIGEMIVGEKRV